MTEPANPEPNASHLNTMFGLPEVCAELIDLLDIPEFKKAWLDYCRLYNAPKEEQGRHTRKPLQGSGLRYSLIPVFLPMAPPCCRMMLWVNGRSAS